MNKTIMKKIKRWMLLALICPWLFACADGGIPKPPFSMPFSLDKGGEVAEFQIRIVEKQTYTFGVAFIVNDKDPNDEDRVWKLVGSAGKNIYTKKYVDLGVSLTMRLKIESIKNATDTTYVPFILDKTSSEIALYAGGSSYDKKIDNVLLEPGMYKVRIDNLLAAPATKGTPINLIVHRAYLGK